MDDTLPAQNAPAVEDNSVAAPPAAEPSTEVQTEVQGQTSEPTVPDTNAQESSSGDTAPAAPVAEQQPAPAEPERQPRPAERKIRELVQQNKQLREQLVTPPLPQTPPQAPKLSDLVQGRESLDPAELDQLGQEVYQQGAQAASGRTGLEVAQLRQEMVIRDAINETDKTASELPLEYKELNPHDPTFNPALEAKIVARYQKEAVRPNPMNPQQRLFDASVKLADVAKEEVEFFREATEYGKAQSSAALSSHADEAAVTPTSATPAPDKSFDEMSLEQQEAHLRAQGHDV